MIVLDLIITTFIENDNSLISADRPGSTLNEKNIKK